MEKKEDPYIYPVIKALPRFDFVGGLMFWCPWCKRFHLHGRGEGHRVAHCIYKDGKLESPLKEKGYILKPMSRKELKQLRDAIQQELDNPWYHRGKLIKR